MAAVFLLLSASCVFASNDSTGTRPAIIGADVGYGSRSNGESGLEVFALYRTPLGGIDFEGSIFQRFFGAGDSVNFSIGRFGFGFGFGCYVPDMIAFGSSGITVEPKLGVNFTVWTSTVGIGIPAGAEVHIPIVTSWDASIAATVEPQINLNAVKNTTIVDVRVGIRYH